MDKTVVEKLNIRRLVLTSLFFAVAVVLSVVEDAVHLPLLAPGVKLGLSNIVVMYSLFFLGKKQAFAVAFLKSFFVLITRGYIAGLISFSGGLSSIAAMSLLLFFLGNKISYLTISISGSIFHNFGQLAIVSLLYTNLLFVSHIPILLISGIVAGAATSTLLRVVLPALNRLGLLQTTR